MKTVFRFLLFGSAILFTGCDSSRPVATQTGTSSQSVATVDEVSKVNRFLALRQVTASDNTGLPSLNNLRFYKEDKFIVLQPLPDDPTTAVKIPRAYVECLSTGPKGIRDLNDGLLLDAYQFKRGDEAALSFLGFNNISFNRNETITVVEYSQRGSQICNNERLHYGVGARLMLRIISKKGGAKVSTPQQLTASVIFGKAEVRYSVATFGIVGPGTAKLVGDGTINENTYSDFIKNISDLIVSCYANNSQYIITPQPLFIKGSDALPM